MSTSPGKEESSSKYGIKAWSFRTHVVSIITRKDRVGLWVKPPRLGTSTIIIDS